MRSTSGDNLSLGDLSVRSVDGRSLPILVSILATWELIVALARELRYKQVVHKDSIHREKDFILIWNFGIKEFNKRFFL